MKKSINTLITTMLLGGAIFLACMSSVADGKNFDMSSQVIYGTPSDNNSGQRDSEFWSKFRDSVMPDDKNKPSTEKENPTPSTSHERSRG